MTINEKQAVINNKAVELYNKFFDEFKPLEQKTMNVKRLRSCNACVVKDVNGYIALRSYKTIVSFITPHGDFVDVLRLVYHYTNTSAYHIAKFYDDYAGNCKNYYTYRPINK